MQNLYEFCHLFPESENSSPEESNSSSPEESNSSSEPAKQGNFINEY